MPRHEQAPADQVVDLAFLRGERALLHRHRGGNDGVMIADLAVVDIPLTQSAFPGSRSQLLAVRSGNDRGYFGNRLGDIGREMTAVGPWIADEFVLLIKRLSHIECFLRAEAVEAVGMPLQFREVVQQGRWYAHGF